MKEFIDRHNLYIAAVSGGVDSMVMLDMLAESRTRCVVVYVDHGWRKDTQSDREVVERASAKYGYEYVFKWLQKSDADTETKARNARYDILCDVMKDKRAVAVLTAHHQDDLLETGIINMIRGTGWRGLASLRSDPASDHWLIRPLLGRSKVDLVRYAIEHDVEWHEDETNEELSNIRNIVRHGVVPRFQKGERSKMLGIATRQSVLRSQIEAELSSLSDTARYDQGWSRYFLIMVGREMASEMIRYIVRRESSISLTRPQTDRVWLALATGRPGTQLSPSAGVVILIHKHYWVVGADNALK